MDHLRPTLSVNHLTTVFSTRTGDFTAVNDVSFEVYPGECLGIVGESGSGKSVATLSVMGLIDYPGKITSGEVIFEGRDLRKLGTSEIRKLRGSRMTIIFQDPQTALNPLFPVGKQMIDVVRAHRSCSKKDAADLAVEKLKLVGMSAAEQRLKAYPWELSGGLRQRVAIAMALLHEPTLVIADEPTTALDVSIQAQIIELLHSLKEQLHFSLIFISHDLGVVANIADRVMVMYAGRAVEQGPVRETFRSPNHPYTNALLGSAPTLASDRSAPLAAIKGSLSLSQNLKQGCVFAPRCEFVQAACLEREPMLVSHGDPNRAARCIFPLNLAATEGAAR
jgi:oligopeptide/dipeptide ABC transporter ATP-binding protein